MKRISLPFWSNSSTSSSSTPSQSTSNETSLLPIIKSEQIDPNGCNDCLLVVRNTNDSEPSFIILPCAKHSDSTNVVTFKTKQSGEFRWHLVHSMEHKLSAPFTIRYLLDELVKHDISFKLKNIWSSSEQVNDQSISTLEGVKNSSDYMIEICLFEESHPKFYFDASRLFKLIINQYQVNYKVLETSYHSLRAEIDQIKQQLQLQHTQHQESTATAAANLRQVEESVERNYDITLKSLETIKESCAQLTEKSAAALYEKLNQTVNDLQSLTSDVDEMSDSIEAAGDSCAKLKNQIQTMETATNILKEDLKQLNDDGDQRFSNFDNQVRTSSKLMTELVDKSGKAIIVAVNEQLQPLGNAVLFLSSQLLFQPHNSAVNLAKRASYAYFIQVESSDLYWDVKNASKEDMAPVILFSLHGGSNQRFRFKPTSWGGDNDLFSIHADHSEHQVTVKGREEESASIVMRPHLNSRVQMWKLSSFATGVPITITNKLSNKFLTVQKLDNTEPLIQSSQSTHRILLTQVPLSAQYFIRLADTDGYLDTHHDDNTVRLSAKRALNEQQFNFIPHCSGYFKLRSIHNNKIIGGIGSLPEHDEKQQSDDLVYQYEDKVEDWTLWKVERLRENTPLTITNKLTGLLLTSVDCVAKQLTRRVDLLHQQWVIVNTSAVG